MSYSHSVRALLLVALLLSAPAIGLVKAQAPQPAATQNAAKPVVKKYRLRITRGDVIGVSLRANNAKLSEITADLAKQLGTQVFLSKNLTAEKVTIEFKDLPLEMGLRLLAPRVVVDSELRENAPATILGVFLMNHGEPDPATNTVIQANNQSMMVSGNTEDTGENTTADDPLHVELDDNNLITVKSKKQPLAAVVLTIAELLGVPADIRNQSDEMVDIELKDMRVEDAVLRLSPNVRFYVRDDLTKSTRTPIRLTVVAPVAKPADAASNSN